MEKAIPLKPSDKLAKVYQSLNSEDKTLPLLPIKDDPQHQRMTLNQTFFTLKIVKTKLQKRQSKMLTCPRNLCLDFFVAWLFSPRLILFKNLCK